jgi:hypothetical protein
MPRKAKPTPDEACVLHLRDLRREHVRPPRTFRSSRAIVRRRSCAAKSPRAAARARSAGSDAHRRIEGATRALEAPAGWSRRRQGSCGARSFRDEATITGPAMTSAWFPTAEEIEPIRHSAPVYLTVLGLVHPPVAIAVGPVPPRPRRLNL